MQYTVLRPNDTLKVTGFGDRLSNLDQYGTLYLMQNAVCYNIITVRIITQCDPDMKRKSHFLSNYVLPPKYLIVNIRGEFYIVRNKALGPTTCQ